MQVECTVIVHIGDDDLRRNKFDLKAAAAHVLDIDAADIIGELTWQYESNREYADVMDRTTPIGRMTIDGEAIYVDEDEAD